MLILMAEEKSVYRIPGKTVEMFEDGVCISLGRVIQKESIH